MKVSVLMTTYNQEGLIAQAIDSVLMQEVNFDYEMVIGEDASTDRTREIVLEFQKQYPDKIRVLLRDAIDAERDRAASVGGKGCFVNALQACKGEYVALLDGDDYWTDGHKLQRQVDFLEKNPDFAICYHNVELFYEDSSREPAIYCPPSQKEISTIEDLLVGNFMQSCSVMFRNHLFGELPYWFYSAMMGDWILHILNGQQGKIGYLNEVMAVYRVHQGGFWTSLSLLEQAKDNIQILDHLVDYLDDKYKRPAKAARAKAYQYLSETYYQRGDMANARSSLLQSLRICLSNKSIPDRQLVGRLIKLQTFSSYEWLRLRFTRT